MSWVNLNRDVETLEASTVNAVYGDIDYLKSALSDLGYPMGSITAPNVSYATLFRDVRDKLNIVEGDFDRLNEVFESVFYGVQRIIGDEVFAKKDYQRWVDILNDLYDIIVNGKGQWEVMYLTRETGNPDAQIDGNDICIRGEAIG